MNPIREYYPNGQIMSEEYRNDKGELHNDNGPALYEWYQSGQIKYVKYHVNGRRHNANGPAYREWHRSGQMMYEVYCVNGLWHNANGPACRWWYESGQILCEAYYINGQLHNTKGPARRWRISDQPNEKDYYLNDDRLKADQWRDRTKPAEILRVISLLPYPIAVEVGHHYCVA
jgi:hypothetical protein